MENNVVSMQTWELARMRAGLLQSQKEFLSDWELAIAIGSLSPETDASWLAAAERQDILLDRLDKILYGV